MELPFLARLVGAALFLVLYITLWRRYRPSGHQHFAALIAGLAVGFYDWAGEVFLIGWDVWHYQGGTAFHIKGVPMEMVLGFMQVQMPWLRWAESYRPKVKAKALVPNLWSSLRNQLDIRTL